MFDIFEFLRQMIYRVWQFIEGSTFLEFNHFRIDKNVVTKMDFKIKMFIFWDISQMLQILCIHM